MKKNTLVKESTQKKEVKEYIGIRASKTGIDNCNKIAEKKDRSFSYVVSKAMEIIKIEDV